MIRLFLNTWFVRFELIMEAIPDHQNLHVL